MSVTRQAYAFAGDNPFNVVDPTGQWTILDDLTAVTVGATVGAVLSVITQETTTGQIDWGQVGMDAVAGAAGAETALYLGPIAGEYAAAAAGGAVTGFVSHAGTQAHQEGGLCNINGWELLGSTALGGVRGAAAANVSESAGLEIRVGELRVGNDLRAAPFGHVPGGRNELEMALPHYHRQGPSDPATGRASKAKGSAAAEHGNGATPLTPHSGTSSSGRRLRTVFLDRWTRCENVSDPRRCGGLAGGAGWRR